MNTFTISGRLVAKPWIAGPTSGRRARFTIANTLPNDASGAPGGPAGPNRVEVLAHGRWVNVLEKLKVNEYVVIKGYLRQVSEDDHRHLPAQPGLVMVATNVLQDIHVTTKDRPRPTQAQTSEVPA